MTWQEAIKEGAKLQKYYLSIGVLPSIAFRLSGSYINKLVFEDYKLILNQVQGKVV